MTKIMTSYIKKRFRCQIKALLFIKMVGGICFLNIVLRLDSVRKTGFGN